MPSVYKKKKSDRTYSKNDILAAVARYKNREGSIRQISNESGIPRSTLSDWITNKWEGTVNRPTLIGREDHFGPGRPTELSPEIEEYLVSALEYLGDAGTL